MSWTYPHEFHDGTGEVASGVQVNDNFAKAKEKVEAAEAKAAQLSSGQAVSTVLAPTTNTHTQIPASEVKTPALTSGQVLFVWTTFVLEPAGNEVLARLTVNGTESGYTPAATGTAPVVRSVCQRLTGLTGVVSLAAKAWASSAAGAAYATVDYMVLNA